MRRADAGDDVIDHTQSLDSNEDDPSDEKIGALAELICCSGNEPAIRNVASPDVVSRTRHPPESAREHGQAPRVTHCGELDL